VKILDFLKSSMSLAEVGWHFGKMNQPSAVLKIKNMK
jgi:hypothetical protein